jgi:hypothetical protein
MPDGMNVQPRYEITIQRESFHVIAHELPDLMADFHSDITKDQALPPMNINYDAYRRIENAGMLRVFTVRWGGALVGTLMFLVSPSLHHAEHKWASSDNFWISPGARRPGVSLRLVRFAEATLGEEGVFAVRYGAKTLRPALSRILEHEGYTAVEIVHQKVLA